MKIVLEQKEQELDGLISQARVQYGKLCVSQHDLGATLLKIRDATKAQGSRKGKGFEACLEEIGISKTQAYRLMKAAETGEPVDYGNDDFVPNGTKFVPLEEAEPWMIEAAVYFGMLNALGVEIGEHDGTPCLLLPHGVVITAVGAIFPDGLTHQQWLQTYAILNALGKPLDDEPPRRG